MMRKVFLFLLGLLLWGAAYSTPASIFQDKIEPTDDQKAEFFRKVSEDPELYSYNPMHVGNIWWYETDWFVPGMSDTPRYIGRTILGSMYIEGNMFYKWFGGLGSPPGFWARNIDDITILWDHHGWSGFDDLDDDPDTDFLVHQDFTITNQDVYNPTMVWALYGPTGLDACYFDGSGWTNIYGRISQYRDYFYVCSAGAFTYSMRWIRGFGPVALWTNEACAYLVGCIINGTHFGSTGNMDDTVTELDDINMYIYPNPSQEGFHIQYQVPQKYANSTLRILNLRGQLILQKQLPGTGEYSWNGRDSTQNRLAKGIYLIQIVSPQGLSKTKKVTLK